MKVRFPNRARPMIETYNQFVLPHATKGWLSLETIAVAKH